MALPISYTDNSRLDPFASSPSTAYLDGSNWSVDFGSSSPAASLGVASVSPVMLILYALAAVAIWKLAKS